MGERKLATIVRVSEIRPIEGADSIEVARVRGWDVVVGKGQYKEGDLAVYFEIDSALPLHDPRFEQFAPRGEKTMPDGSKAHVLKTIRLRGQVSQGLLMSLDELGYSGFEGDDLTDAIGIVKWEPPLPGTTDIKGNFPTQYASKTDSERVQNISDAVWATILEKEWVATEKVDGTSVTAIKTEDGELIVCSRNYIVGEESLHHKAVKSMKWRIPKGMAVQGEVVGPGIQGNPLQLNETRILVFDVWRDGKLVPRSKWPKFAKDNAVPEFELELPATQEEAVEQANKIKSIVNPKVQAEGIVWHEKSGYINPFLQRSTFKSINNSYLLSH